MPVVRVQDTEHRLGGAANVARQVAALGARVSLAGVIGEDDAGRGFSAPVRALRISTRAPSLRVPARRTTRKLRVLGHSQQLLRLDWEDAAPCAPQLCARLVAKLADGAPPDAIILSDYAKGVLTPADDRRPRGLQARRLRWSSTPSTAISRATAARRPSLPTCASWKRPRAHARRRRHGRRRRRRTSRCSEAAGLESMVVTLGDRGMLVVPCRRAPRSRCLRIRREVYDVTGAGDTAIAVLTLSLAAGRRSRTPRSSPTPRPAFRWARSARSPSIGRQHSRRPRGASRRQNADARRSGRARGHLAHARASASFSPTAVSTCCTPAISRCSGRPRGSGMYWCWRSTATPRCAA